MKVSESTWAVREPKKKNMLKEAWRSLGTLEAPLAAHRLVQGRIFCNIGLTYPCVVLFRMCFSKCLKLFVIMNEPLGRQTRFSEKSKSGGKMPSQLSILGGLGQP